MHTRRQFVRGLATGGTAAALDLWHGPASALSGPGSSRELAGTEFDLVIAETPLNFTGRQRPAVTINGSLPGPTLRWREGTTVNLRVSNALPAHSVHGGETAIHWHGMILPASMDGVPGLSFPGIRRGETFQYRFTVRQSGTYWYHGHSGLQEQAGLYGALIIDPATPEPFAYDRDYVVMLNDWTDLAPAALLARLKKMPGYDNMHQRTLGDFMRDARRNGFKATLADRLAWGAMRMSPTDLSDVNAHSYTYLMNGATSLGNWTALFSPGEKLRLRFINGSAMTYFDVRIPGLKMTVVAADGQYVHPVTVDEFRIAVAETFDVIVEPAGQEAFTLFAQDAARTGFVRGTLAVRMGMSAPVPLLEPRPLLSMADMSMSAHLHSEGMDMPAMDMSRQEDPGLGLRDNGRAVLSYAMLHSLFDDPDGREPGREIELRLTGNMDKFAWSFNGVKFPAAEAIRMNLGERLRIVLVNETMMSHPIHLHGMWSDLEDGSGNFAVRKHTVDIPPGARRSYRVSADAPGNWAFHCHLLYHMEAGMMRQVKVEKAS